MVLVVVLVVRLWGRWSGEAVEKKLWKQEGVVTTIVCVGGWWVVGVERSRVSSPLRTMHSIWGGGGGRRGGRGGGRGGGRRRGRRNCLVNDLVDLGSEVSGGDQNESSKSCEYGWC